MIFTGASHHHRITAILIVAFLAVMVNVSVIPTPAHAVTAEEQLSDPVLEDRARDLFLQPCRYTRAIVLTETSPATRWQ